MARGVFSRRSGRGWLGGYKGAVCFAEEGEALEQGDLAAAAAAQARMWLAADASVEVRGLTEEMTRLSYELQLPVEGAVTGVWPDPPAADRLAAISTPTLVVVGSEDVPDILEIANLLADGIPGAQRAVIDGAGHLPSLERPEELNRLLLEFLRQ